MAIRESLRIALTISFTATGLMAGLLVFPASAHAAEVGCFCTFLFVSTMLVLGISLTLLVKHLLSKRIWKLSLTRTVLITFLEVVMLVAILFLLQTHYAYRVMAYLPLAFLLNFALTTSTGPIRQEQQSSGKRFTMAVVSCMALPIAVQIMAWLAMVLSNMITFTEFRV